MRGIEMRECPMEVRTIRLKVKREAYPWLGRACSEVNQVWNWANETSERAIRRFSGKPVWLSGFDLNNLSSGATRCFDHIGADTIQRVNGEYAAKRNAAKKARLSWRKSSGSRRSLGWIPFKGINLKHRGKSLRFAGKTFRVFEADRLAGLKWRDGCFAQDACGDWWLCLPVAIQLTDIPAPNEIVGIDLGLLDTATTSDAQKLVAGRFYRGIENRISKAQCRGHRRQAKRLHRKASRQRKDAIHKFTTRIVCQYQNIIIGNVSSYRLAKTRMAKSVLDAGWGMLKAQLQYKGQQAGRRVEVVNEAYTTRACSSCGSLTGPGGLRQLVVRDWQCSACGAQHDRDVNAARNIASLGSRYMTSVRGNEPNPSKVAA